jgi:hypothetical protein
MNFSYIHCSAIFYVFAKTHLNKDCCFVDSFTWELGICDNFDLFRSRRLVARILFPLIAINKRFLE